MSIPESLVGDKWARVTARSALPILVWCAKKGKLITYGQLDHEIVRRDLGTHVVVVRYRYPADAIGRALIELEERWDEAIPPLNSIIVSAKNRLPGKGFNQFLERYYQLKKRIERMNPQKKRDLIKKLHEEVFTYQYWDYVLDECGLTKLKGRVQLTP